MDPTPPVGTQDASRDRPPAGRPGGADNRYLLVVGVMLVVVIGMLAALWIRERRARVAAENGILDAQKQVEGMRMLIQKLQFSQALGVQPAPGEGGVKPFSWAEDCLPGKGLKALLEGEPMAPLAITWQAGTRLGFRPGDLVYVSPAPASRPASSRPAGP